MKRKVFLLIAALLTVSLGVGMSLLMHGSREKHREIACSGMELSFRDSLKFVSEDDIKRFLDRNYGVYIGQRLDSVKLHRIEELIESRSVVMNSEVWTSPDGILHIEISQRAPVLRLMNGEQGFYIDAEGDVFPLHKSYTADVPVLEGKVSRDSLFLQSALELHNFLEDNPKCSVMVEKMSIDEKGELNIVTSRGEERFVLGQIEDLKGKFAKIDKYYAYIVPNAGEGKYRTVIVKYKNQIICREKDI